MKAKISLAAIVMAGFILFAACSTSSSGTKTTSTPATSAAYNTGSVVGQSLLGIYQQYKSSGKIDLKDPTTLLQLLALSTQVETVKQNYKNASFYADFAKGAVFGSQNNISNNNVGSVINALTGLNLGGITSNGGVPATNVNNVVDGLTTILKLFGK